MDMPSQIGDSSPLPNEVINYNVNLWFHLTFKERLFSQSSKPAGARMVDNVCLYNIALNFPVDNLPQIFSQNFRNCVNTYTLLRMYAYQYWLPSTSNFNQGLNSLVAYCLPN